jgi:hypothetical protein
MAFQEVMCGACIIVFACYCMLLLHASAPEATDDSGQFRRSWSLGRDKTKQKGKVLLKKGTMSLYLPHLGPGWEFTCVINSSHFVVYIVILCYVTGLYKGIL